jgi:hypothetical protein
MKTTLACFVVALLAMGVCGNASAAPRNTGNSGIDYLRGADDLAGWSFGLYMDGSGRSLRIHDDATTTDIDMARTMMYVGYDVVRWMTLYVPAGEGRAQFGPGSFQDASLAIGGGVQLNLIDVEIPDPQLIEDKLRLNSTIQGIYSSSDYRDGSLDWTELYADLTLGLVNDGFGFSFLSAESLIFFAGPYYSTLLGSDFDGSGGQSQVGMTAGAEMFLTKRVSLNCRGNFGEMTGFAGGLNVRF